MKIIYTLFLFTLFCGCEKLDLPRDNPLDNKYGQTSTSTGITKKAVLKYSKNTFVNEVGYGNNDGIINPGEIIKMIVYLKNVGDKNTDHVECEIKCTNTYISNFGNSNIWWLKYWSGSANSSFNENQEKESTTDFSFKVNNSTPTGTTITFDLSISDYYNNKWSDSFTITVY